jgi:N-acetylated-alpha-linked acidic dipeptidase
LNSKLFLAERQFLGNGLPLRPYFRHVLQAPGLYTGYGSQSFPGVAQTVSAKQWDLANEQLDEAVALILNAAEWLQA